MGLTTNPEWRITNLVCDQCGAEKQIPIDQPMPTGWMLMGDKGKLVCSFSCEIDATIKPIRHELRKHVAETEEYRASGT